MPIDTLERVMVNVDTAGQLLLRLLAFAGACGVSQRFFSVGAAGEPARLEGKESDGNSVVDGMSFEF